MLFSTLVVVLLAVCTYGLPKAIACAIVVVTNQISTHLLSVLLLLLLLMACLREFSVASKHTAHSG